MEFEVFVTRIENAYCKYGAGWHNTDEDDEHDFPEDFAYSLNEKKDSLSVCCTTSLQLINSPPGLLAGPESTDPPAPGLLQNGGAHPSSQ